MHELGHGGMGRASPPSSLPRAPPQQDYPLPPPSPPQPVHSNGVSSGAEPAQDESGAAKKGARATRLRKACDSCSIRKVKCDESGPPCMACEALDIPCTFDRPTRRRGPPNRHAEAIKRQKLAANPNGSPPTTASPQQPSFAQTVPTPPTSSAESIAPMELIHLLVDDFFTYIHPITPFPHETWFRQALAQRRDVSDRSLLALLAGMIGALVAGFPRRPLKRIRQLQLGHIYPSAVSLLQRCQHVIHEARGPGYLASTDLNIYDAATSYYLLVITAFTYQLGLGNLYLGECYNILRVLGLHRPQQNPDRAVNYIEQEMARRLYWVVFVTVVSARTLGLGMDDVFMPIEIPGQPHPPLPLEVDDRFIFPDHVDPQPRDIVPKIAGFCFNIRVYLTHDPLTAAEFAWGVNRKVDLNLQKSVLQQCLINVKSVHESLPEIFALWRNVTSRSPTGSTASSAISDPNLGDAHRIGPDFVDDEQRRYITYEIQKANIHASLLSTRSYFVERYWSLCETQQTQVPNQFDESRRDLRIERESIASDLLNVLFSIKPVHMEPNCLPFCMKIRQIAATLLPSDMESDGVPDQRAQYFLRNFLEILTDLEKSGARKGRPLDEETDEEDENDLRKWADLREFQRAFAEKGGVLGRLT